MSKGCYKKKLKKAIDHAINHVLGRMTYEPERRLYLTRKQYEIDPDGWHDVLRQFGLPDDAIVFIPDSFEKKGGLDD